MPLGAATSKVGERLEAVVQRVDSNLYADKRRYYQTGQVMDWRNS
jgi:hypothetical protein